MAQALTINLKPDIMTKYVLTHKSHNYQIVTEINSAGKHIESKSGLEIKRDNFKSETVILKYI
jgi:hypothetical protein